MNEIELRVIEEMKMRNVITAKKKRNGQIIKYWNEDIKLFHILTVHVLDKYDLHTSV